MYYPDCTVSIQPGSLVKMIHSFQYPAEIFLPIFSQILCLIYFHFEAKILRVTNAVTHSIVIVTKTIINAKPARRYFVMIVKIGFGVRIATKLVAEIVTIVVDGLVACVILPIAQTVIKFGFARAVKTSIVTIAVLYCTVQTVRRHIVKDAEM